MEINSLADALEIVAKSPWALLGYLGLIVGWVTIALKVNRNREVLRRIESLPSSERASVLQMEMGGTFQATGLSPKQWLEAQRQRYVFLGFLAVCGLVLSFVIVATILLYLANQSPGPEVTPAKTGETGGGIGSSPIPYITPKKDSGTPIVATPKNEPTLSSPTTTSIGSPGPATLPVVTPPNPPNSVERTFQLSGPNCADPTSTNDQRCSWLDEAVGTRRQSGTVQISGTVDVRFERAYPPNNLAACNDPWRRGEVVVKCGSTETRTSSNWSNQQRDLDVFHHNYNIDAECRTNGAFRLEVIANPRGCSTMILVGGSVIVEE